MHNVEPQPIIGALPSEPALRLDAARPCMGESSQGPKRADEDGQLDTASTIRGRECGLQVTYASIEERLRFGSGLEYFCLQEHRLKTPVPNDLEC